MKSFRTRKDEIIPTFKGGTPQDQQIYFRSMSEVLAKNFRDTRTDLDMLKEALYVIKNNRCDINYIKCRTNASNPTYQITLTYGKIWIGEVFADTDATTLTLDITTSGALGLDTGSEAVNTWYYVYLIAKSSGEISAIFSTSSSAPTLPSGYEHYRLVSAVYNDSGGDFEQFRQLRDIYLYTTTQIALVITSPMSSATLIDASQWVPDYGREVFFTSYIYDYLSGGSVRPITRVYNRSWGTNTMNSYFYVNPTTASSLSGRNNVFGSVYTDDRTFQVYLYEDTGSTPTTFDAKVYIAGFRFDF